MFTQEEQAAIEAHTALGYRVDLVALACEIRCNTELGNPDKPVISMPEFPKNRLN